MAYTSARKACQEKKIRGNHRGLNLQRFQYSIKPLRRLVSPAFSTVFSTFLKDQLQCKLYLPRRCQRSGDLSRRRQHRLGSGARERTRCKHSSIRRIEVRVVQNVENLGAEFELPALAQLWNHGIFHDREIQVR